MESRRSKPKVYRQGDPLTCQRIWDVIKQIRIDRKSATAANILRYYCKSFTISTAVLDRQLKFLLHDGLILQKITAPVKGSNKGVEQTVYCIPNESEVDLSGKNDWYCFQCHKPGEVLACVSCPRVFHITCLTDVETEELDNGFICPPCKEINVQPVCDDFGRAELNLLLSFACTRLEEKLPIDNYNWNPLNNPAHNTPFTTDRCAALLKKLPHPVSTSEEGWRSKFLLKLPVSLPKINDRTDRQVYKSIAQFQTDCATVVHNITLFHGEHSSLADSARVMKRDCLYELEEIKLCPDCYRRSNKQDEKDWFCQPCDPPHELVFAKAKGYPFWPAKVLKISDDLYDVRFFGAGHDRALLDKNFIRPITFNINSVVNKRSAAWVKAMEEMRAHQALLLEVAACSEEDEVVESRSEASKVERPTAIFGKSPCRNVTVSINRLSRSLTDQSANSLGIKCPPETTASLDSLNVNLSPNVGLGEKLALENATLKKEIQELKENRATEIKLLQETHERNKMAEIEALRQVHAVEIQTLKDEYENQIALNKKKQWCSNCGKEGLYHCCINVQYCSTDCQQVHWKSAHKKICRRERDKSEKEKK